MREITKKRIRRICRICHKKSFHISQNGKCVNCCKDLVKSANLQMKTKAGPVYDKWKKRIIESTERL